MALRGTLLTSFSLCASVATLLLSGCSANFSPSNTFQPEQVPIGPIQGSVHGGQAPVSGGHIYLYAAGTSGYGSQSSSLIAATQITQGSALPSGVSEDSSGHGYVTTDASGNFALSGDYTCTEGQQVYLVAVGGDSGSGANPYIVQMAGLGECPSAGNLAQQDPYVTINEISTVAFAYAMAPFVSSTNPDAYHIGTNGSTAAGLLAIHNAMLDVGYLVNLASGQPQTTMPGNTNVGMPSDKIIHLANILGMCVNTSGSLGTSKERGKSGNYAYTLDPCGYLFSYTTGITEAGGSITTSADEAQAIFNIALNPGSANVANLYNLVQGTTAFNDPMTASPSDWTLPIIYKSAVSIFAQTNGSNTNGPFNIAIDSSGNAWIGDRINGVIRISTNGALKSWNKAFGMIKGVTIAPNGSIWAADYKSSNVYIMDTSGNISKILTTGLSGPAYVAFNTSANAYIVNEVGVSLTVYDSTGTNVLANAVDMNVGNGITTPDFVAIDSVGYAWVPDTGGGTLAKLSPAYAATALNSNTFGQAYWLGFDSSSNLWVGDMNNRRLDYGQFLGNPATGNDTYTVGHVTKTNGGVNQADLGEVDGAGTVWIPNMIVPPSTTASTLSAYSGGVSGGAYLATATAGFSTGCSTTICPNSGGGGTGGAVAAAVDLSGNVWVANEDGTVSELIGLGAPTASPLTPTNAGTMP